MSIVHLTDIEEIKTLKARYFFYLDSKDWEKWKNEVFVTDVSFHLPEDRAEPYVGIDEFLEILIPRLDGVKSVHHGHMPIIEIASPTTATGIWAMEDVLFCPPGRFPGVEGRVHGYGHYHETYVRTNDGWRIQSLLLTRIHHLGPL